MRYLNVGDRVKIKMTEDGCAANAMLKKYDGMEARITRRQPVGCNNIPYYELENVESDKGVPYAFMREWLEAL